MNRSSSITIHPDASSSDSDRNWLERTSDQVIDVALLTSIFAVPCLLGGRIAIGQFTLVGCAVVAGLAWSLGLIFGRRPTWTITWVEPLLLGIVGLGLLQMTPLPTQALNLLSPHHKELLPLWSTAGENPSPLGTWQTLSLNVAETRSSLIVGVSYLLLFYVATQRLRRVRDIERVVRWVGCASAAMALFGVVQWLSNNGKFFWFYDYPRTDPSHRLKGAFTNRNHFSQFLVLGCGPLLWWIVRLMDDRSVAGSGFGNTQPSRNQNDTFLAGLLLVLGVLIFAVAFSLSRGGMIALSIAIMIMLAMLFHIGRLSSRVMLGLIGIGAVSASLFMKLGYEKVSQRLDHWRSDIRLAIWQANLQIFADFPIFGTGLGTHAEAYPIYFDPPFGEAEFTHAENSYLQVASESGLAGVALALLCVSCCGLWCLRNLRTRSEPRVRLLAAAIAASLAANLVHAAVDFVWYVPGLMTMVLLLAACARRLDQLSVAKVGTGRIMATSSSSSRRSLVRGLGFLTACTVIGIAMWSQPKLSAAIAGEAYWFDYLRIVFRSDYKAESDADVTDTASSQKAEMQRFKQRVSALSHATKLNPQQARPHLRLATAYLTAFEHLQGSSENPMTRSQLRDAALAANFESVDAMREWLQRAVGPNLKYLDGALKHARRAVQLCPLQGQGYVHLAELAFLENLDPQQPLEFLAQAERVRPHSAEVQFVVGREALLAGHLEEALKSWKNAFHQDLDYQRKILDLLVGIAPAELIVQQLEPDLAALERIEARFREMPRSQYAVIGNALIDALTAESNSPECDQPIERLLSAANIAVRLNDIKAAEASYRQAIDLDRSSYVARKAYGMFLFQQNQFSRATEHLQWCLRVNPSDGSLRKVAEEAISHGLRSESGVQQTGFQNRTRKRK